MAKVKPNSKTAPSPVVSNPIFGSNATLSAKLIAYPMLRFERNSESDPPLKAPATSSIGTLPPA